MELKKIIRIYLIGFKCFIGFPIKMSKDNKITKPYPILKWASSIIPLLANFALFYFYGFTMGLDQIRSNPYLLLGYLRALLFLIFSYVGVFLTIAGNEKLISIIQTLIDLQEKHKFSKTKLRVMLCIALLQLFTLYCFMIMAFYLSYDAGNINNVFIQIMISSSAMAMIVPIFTCELFYINCSVILALYFETCNKELKNLEESYSNRYSISAPQGQKFIYEN